ncbi:hypothetical protein AIOGIFDO_00808 [Candidatus Methanoperedenaceae archaeon GB37]|nr:hypothetical protein AIOGIFDO_00808 [Candidatus Methanoperedenaceae archaeon GB37]
MSSYTKIKDSINFVYPSKTEQKANFIYTKLGEMLNHGKQKIKKVIKWKYGQR